MDSRNIKEPTPQIEDGKHLEKIYDLQKELLDSYIKIEGLPSYPIDVNSKKSQIILKDFTSMPGPRKKMKNLKTKTIAMTSMRASPTICVMPAGPASLKAASSVTISRPILSIGFTMTTRMKNVMM